MDGLKRYVNDDRFRVDGDKNMRLLAFAFTIVFVWTGPKVQMDNNLFLADNQIRYTNHLCDFSVSDGKKLLSNDRQHFNINPVKLIKTAPGP